jgi:DNA processing protein
VSAPVPPIIDDPEPPPRVRARGYALIERRGPWPVPTRLHVALVGSRRASADGVRVARALAAQLAEVGAVVVSGGAFGIDAAAHVGALDVGGTTLVVLPTGVRTPAPAGNRALFSAVLAAGGAWVAEPSLERGRWSFVRRNRLIAACADVVVVVEADEPSGTRATVDAARALGVPVGVVPWSPLAVRARGNHRLLREGARPVFDADDACALATSGGAAQDATRGQAPSPISAEPRVARTDRPRPGAWRPPPRDPRAAELLEALGAEALGLDALAAATGLAEREVLERLGALELEGRVRPVRGGRYVRVR